MKLLLVHLSDIHLTGEGDVITDRCAHIVDAVKNLDYSLDMCAVIATGDIAYSGTFEQYMVAFEFFDNLKRLLCDNLSNSDEFTKVPVHFIFIPGNHDCDFTASGRLRDIVADSILSDASKASDTEVVGTCTSIQKSFFDFLEALETSPRKKSNQMYDNRLSYEYELQFGDERIRILCCNTAWLSKLNEAQGHLIFPSQAIETKQDDSELTIVAFHHPYNWLESNNAREFRNAIESIADLVLTGHEHTSSWKVQYGSIGRHNMCVEGGVLQDNANPALSEFNAFVFDTRLIRRKQANFRWDDGAYRLTRQSMFGDDGGRLGWIEYRINYGRTIGNAQLAGDMRNYLRDPGISLQHGKRGALTLQDVYVYPDLVKVKISGEHFNQRVSGDGLLKLLDSAPKMLITGDTESGKTSLAKSIFLNFLESGIVPVLVNGNHKPPHGDKVYGYIEQSFSRQYSSQLLETYNQTDKARRAIIIDDYHKLPMPLKRKREFLKSLSSSAKYLIVLAHDLTSDLDELSNPGGSSGSSVNMTHYRIQPFGYVGRDKLVERWMLLGETGDPTDNSFVKQLESVTQTLNTLIGKNYVPSYPVYVLSVLQALDSTTPIDITASTHGYFYELFIRTTLARGRNRKDFDIIASYLAFLAYQMLERRLKRIGAADFKSIHKAYQERYDIERPFESIKKQLISQGIMTNVNDTFRFKYNYLYNYFVASYIRDHISQPNVRQTVRSIACGVHEESNANIMLFLAHLSRDPLVINELLRSSRSLYSNFTPAELADDIKFLEHLWPGLPEVIYEEKDPKANRQAMLAQMDRNSPPETGMDEMDIDQGEEVVDAEDPIVQFITALRHLEISGQVLKNFPGSMEASDKLNIARECFHLGLKSLSVVFEMLKIDQSDILREMSEEIRLRRPGLASSEIYERARESLIGLVHVLAYGLISRVAKAVGSRDLFNTYDRLLKESETPAFRLIHSALNLDNSDEFPETLIRRMAHEFRDIPLPLSVLRHLVITHFHLFPVDFRTKQSISSTLGVKYANLQRSAPRPTMLPSHGS